MIRRIVCWMLVPTLLANHAALCFGHHHHGLESDDHAARSHVHLFGHSHDGDHIDHHHGETGEHNHSNGPCPNENESCSGFDSNWPADHDDDAIFFGEQDTLQSQPSRTNFDSTTCEVLGFATLISRAARSIERSRIARAGPFLPYHCAIYLQTRCLLI